MYIRDETVSVACVYYSVQDMQQKPSANNPVNVLYLSLFFHLARRWRGGMLSSDVKSRH